MHMQINKKVHWTKRTHFHRKIDYGNVLEGPYFLKCHGIMALPIHLHSEEIHWKCILFVQCTVIARTIINNDWLR